MIASDLNQNFIEGMFKENSSSLSHTQKTKSPDKSKSSKSSIKRDQTFQISLTSRQSMANHGLLSNHRSSINDPENPLNLCINQIQKMDQFINSLAHKNNNLDIKLSQIFEDAKNIYPPNNTAINDFMILKEQALNNKINNYQNQKYNNNSYNNNCIKKSCENCTKVIELNKIIQQQCDQRLNDMEQRYQQQIQCLIKQKEKIIADGIRQTLHTGVQINILQQNNQKLQRQIKELTNQLQNVNMDRSHHFQITKNIQERMKLQLSKFKYMSATKNSTDVDSLPRNLQSMIFDPYCQSDYGDLISVFLTQHLNTQVKQNNDSRYLRNSVQSDYKSTDHNEKLYKMYQKLIRELNQIKQFRKKHGIQVPRAQQIDNKRIHNILQNSKQASKLNENQDNNINELEAINKSLKQKVDCLQRQNKSLQQTIKQSRVNSKMLYNLKSQREQLMNQNIQLRNALNQLNLKIQKYQKILNEEKSMNRQLKLDNQAQKYILINQKQDYSKMIQQIQNEKGVVRTYCRFRPPFQYQLEKYKNVNISQKWIEKQMSPFDKVFSGQTKQDQIFSEIKRLVYCATQGQSLCILSFGHQRSGKSYTIHGTKQNPGLSLHLIKQLYRIIQKEKSMKKIAVQFSMVQLYMDKILDLNLIPNNNREGRFQQKKIQIGQDSQGNIILQNCNSQKISNQNQMEECYYKALSYRRVKKHNNNTNNQHEQQLQGTFIFTIKLNIKDHKQKKIKTSKITLVDLSSVVDISLNYPSSYALQNNQKLNHLLIAIHRIKYREKNIQMKHSKLLHILKDTLTKNTRIALFFTMSPFQSQQNKRMISDIKKLNDYGDKNEKTDRTSTSKHSNQKILEQKCSFYEKSPFNRNRRVRSSVDNYE